MLFEDERILIYHPGKCGGTTIENLFLKRLRNTDLARILRQPSYGTAGHDKLSADWLQCRLGLMLGYLPRASCVNGIGGIYLQHADIHASLKLLGMKGIGQTYKIAFVRNPFPRLLSAYYYNRGYRRRTFKDFVLNQLEDEIQKNRPFTIGHFGPMHRYTHFEGMQFVDFIGRLERIEVDLGELSTTICLPLELGGERQNAKTMASKAYEHYSQAYDDEMVERLYELYREDFDHFGYSFERVLPFRPQDDIPVPPK